MSWILAIDLGNGGPKVAAVRPDGTVLATALRPVSVDIRLDGTALPDRVDAVTADFRFDHSDAWEARLADYTLAGIPVYHSKDLYESLTGRADLEHLSENTFGALGPMASLLDFKQVLDRLVALPAIIVMLPLFAVSTSVASTLGRRKELGSGVWARWKRRAVAHNLL